jgi:tRNA 2-thiouridine synthesizing protein D
MKIQINVYGSPWSGNSAEQATAFIKQALAQGHHIRRVFFYFDGVYHGLKTQSPATDEFNLLARWKDIAAQNVDLFLCIAAATNRGVLNDEESKRQGHSVSTVADFFEITGLGQWASGFHDVDRIMTFK